MLTGTTPPPPHQGGVCYFFVNATTTLWMLTLSCPAKLIYLIFHLPEVVSRYRDPQLQVDENYSYLYNLRQNICQS